MQILLSAKLLEDLVEEVCSSLSDNNYRLFIHSVVHALSYKLYIKVICCETSGILSTVNELEGAIKKSFTAFSAPTNLIELLEPVVPTIPLPKISCNE